MKIIIWGLPLHSHTHSYIHQAFARAAYYMNHEVSWLENSLESNEFLNEGSVVISCGVADSNLVYKSGVNYVLHNSSREDLRYGNYLNLQVYTHDVLNRSVENLGNLTYWQQENKTLYQPWATDLLPNEIKKIKPNAPSANLKDIFWVGSVMTGDQGNYEELSTYATLCERKSLQFKNVRGLSIFDNVKIMQQSRHSLAIQGKWQVEKGYVPCRILKNISYGCWSLTNSPTVASLLEIPYYSTMTSMFEAAESYVTSSNIELLKDKMKLISEKHTYVNRLEKILSFFK